jgi:hypothetical protein
MLTKRKPSPILLRCDFEIREQIKQAALRERRSMNNFLITIFLRSQGLPLPEEQELDIGFPE